MRILQKEICRLSSINKNKEALCLVERYVFHIAVRVLAINRVKSKSGSTSGIDNIYLRTPEECLHVLDESK